MSETAYTPSTRVYTDIQALKQLQYDSTTKNAPSAKKEVAEQFQAILMQMVLGSMREANKAFSSGEFGSDQMDMYQDLFDKQLSLLMSNSGMGFSDLIEKSIDQTQNGMATAVPSAPAAPMHAAPTTLSTETVSTPLPPQIANNSFLHPIPIPTNPVEEKKTFSTEEEFVKGMWSYASKAADMIGASPEVLIAQAALETNWGKNIIGDTHQSTHNVFNIKADPGWKEKATTVETLEQQNGVLVKEKAKFRNYGSFKESFLDYVNFLKQNDRYGDSLKKSHNPEQFVNALQHAGYATDPNYADKIIKIFSSQSFKNIVNKVRGL